MTASRSLMAMSYSRPSARKITRIAYINANGLFTYLDTEADGSDVERMLTP